MKCPKCKKEIKEVNIISECWQKGKIKRNKIIDVGSVEEITGTIKIEHSQINCWADITNLITE